MTDIYEMLNAIDPSVLDYNDWLAVGMAIHGEGGSPQDWEDWSARDSRPGKYKPGECTRKWAGFRGSANPVTAGTLFELARRAGWQGSQHSNEPDIVLDWDAVIHQPSESLRIIDIDWVEPADLTPPNHATWQPMKELKTYLTTLFDASEFVGYVTESWLNEDGKWVPRNKGSYTRTCGELLSELTRYKDDFGAVFGDTDYDGGAWIRFNPLDGHGVRDDNVTSFRYALIESDTVAVETQAAVYEKLQLPIAALVHSGGKSLHAIVRVDAMKMDEYRNRVNFLHKVCAENGLEIDTSNKNPSRLSRMPGVKRSGQMQYLVAVNQGRSTWDDWKEFYDEAHDQSLPEFEPMGDIWANMPSLKPPLIDGVLREGHKMLLSGPSKAGKSFMLLQLALALAEGKTWLGWPCSQGKVLYVNLELDPASCAHRIRDLYRDLGWEPNNLDNIDLWNLRGKAVPMDILAPKLIRRALKRKYKAIIIDPIYKVITGDENAADKMAYFCNQFDRICAELGAAVIYCHHHSKGAQGAKSARDRSSGSGVFARDPDAILDIIELVGTKDAKKAMVDRIVAEFVGQELDKLRPGWRESNDIGQDDIIVGHKVLEYATGLLGPGSGIEEDVVRLRSTMQNVTGWRMEGTLREFAPMKPRHFWFRYPYHTTEGSEFLLDAKAEGEEPPWKADQAAKKAKAQKADVGIQSHYNALAFEKSVAYVGELATQCGKEEKQVEAWAKKTAGLVLCADHGIREKADAELFKVEWAFKTVSEKDPDGVVKLKDLTKELKVSINTARDKVDAHPGFERVDGRVVAIHKAKKED